MPERSVDTPRTTFIRRLRKERRAAHMTQADLARRMTEWLGSTVDKSTVTRMEKGERGISLDQAVAAAHVMNMSIEQMLDTTEEGIEARIEELQLSIASAQLALTAVRSEEQRRQGELDNLIRQLEKITNRRKVPKGLARCTS